MFDFTVRHLRWLAKVPLAPDLFDAWLLGWTALFHREQFRALEKLEARALELWQPCRHRFGGVGFRRGQREFAHLHGNGLLDVRLTPECAAQTVAAGLAQPHHVFGRSAWVSFRLRSEADVPQAMELLREAERLTAARNGL